MLEEEEEEEEEKLGNLVRANEERSRGSQPRFGWEVQEETARSRRRWRERFLLNTPRFILL